MIMIEIVLADTNQILFKCKFSLLDQSGNAKECGETDNRFDAARKSIHILHLSLTREAVLNRKSEYLPDDKLSLVCECTFSCGIEFQTTEETLNEIPLAFIKQKSNFIPRNIIYKAAEKLFTYPNGLDDIKTFYMNQCLTDVVVRTEIKSFPAHKIVLCARSPVFKAMMINDMKEKKTNCLRVDDLEDDIVQHLLFFLYSDNIENLQWESATQLYYAADKYEIGKLKEVCSSFMVENLTPTNVVELLLLADTHSDKNLKKFSDVAARPVAENPSLFGIFRSWRRLRSTNRKNPLLFAVPDWHAARQTERNLRSWLLPVISADRGKSTYHRQRLAQFAFYAADRKNPSLLDVLILALPLTGRKSAWRPLEKTMQSDWRHLQTASAEEEISYQLSSGVRHLPKQSKNRFSS
ncbi:Speckle-type POZ protein [Araneus ventricosus]|uniref:Speckle-type POZ protein n=1 Tax=Araneus ventricosus TaxID=182803 RepID=A0A4Y2PUC2_ARAVE|nr:Speckle-type POZ protein [Araneus ventricosus]